MATMRLKTELGSIVMDLHAAHAPATVAYVSELVAAGHFTDAEFYRSTRLGDETRQPLIQGGPWAPMFTGAERARPRIDLLTTHEATSVTGLRHQRGAVSLARDLFNTGHCLPELFICLDDYPDLDEGGRTEPDARGFPVFAQIIDGLDVVEAIAAQPTNATAPLAHLDGEVMTKPVGILTATIESENP